jgi:hypothetical protein
LHKQYFTFKLESNTSLSLNSDSNSSVESVESVKVLNESIQSNENSDNCSRDSTSNIEEFERFFYTENQIKRILKFSIHDWRRMVSTLTGKRLSFKSSFSDNLSLRLQETGIKI